MADSLNLREIREKGFCATPKVARRFPRSGLSARLPGEPSVNPMNRNTKTLLAVGALLALALPLVSGSLGDATMASDTSSNAANKTSAAGSTVEILSTVAPTSVLSTTIKTSAPQDLIFSVTLECALWTTVQTVGNDLSEAQAKVTIQVLFDGHPVPVSGAGDDGVVVFCDRLHRQETTGFDDENATIKNYLATREANGFNWILPDVGSGVHTVDVQATFLTRTVGDGALAQAGVGHRTLIVEPTHLAQGFTL